MRLRIGWGYAVRAHIAIIEVSAIVGLGRRCVLGGFDQTRISVIPSSVIKTLLICIFHTKVTGSGRHTHLFARNAVFGCHLLSIPAFAFGGLDRCVKCDTRCFSSSSALHSTRWLRPRRATPPSRTTWTWSVASPGAQTRTTADTANAVHAKHSGAQSARHPRRVT